MLIVLLLVLLSPSSGYPLHDIYGSHVLEKAGGGFEVERGEVGPVGRDGQLVGIKRRDEVWGIKKSDDIEGIKKSDDIEGIKKSDIENIEKSDDIERLGRSDEVEPQRLFTGKEGLDSKEMWYVDDDKHVEIGEDGGMYYILLPKQKDISSGLIFQDDEDVLRELEAMSEESSLFEKEIPIKHAEEEKALELLERSLEERIKAEDVREKEEDERERKEELREEEERDREQDEIRASKRSNEIEIDEGLTAYRILLPKQKLFGKIKIGSWMGERDAPETGGRIKGQGDGRGGHTIYRSLNSDGGDVNAFLD